MSDKKSIRTQKAALSEQSLLSIFFQFAGFHSFLIGLFPFYIPVYLWKIGKSISEISFFIALTGIGFCLSLWAFDRLRHAFSLKWLVVFSFLVELGLLTGISYLDNPAFYVCFGFLNGGYNCFFWVIQRLLFFDSVSLENSGKHFGSFQIFVAIVLKFGVLLGGIMLDHYGVGTVYAFSLIVAVLGVVNFSFFHDICLFSPSLQELNPISFQDITSFRDSFFSRYIFAIDGVFLFIESYFWMISLFVIAKESFVFLGGLVIALAVIFSFIFICIKNRIDRSSHQVVFVIAVMLYAGGWILRATVGGGETVSVLGVKLILIAFFTSFFRLAFNKRFFDLARLTLSYRYILFKSYFSQFFLAVVFLAASLVTAGFQLESVEGFFKYLYWTAGLFSLSYIVYSIPKEKFEN